MANMFIPTKIRVGFQKREGTFTGKLAYIIYYDEKGKIRKETSWNSWCDSTIPSVEFENTPRNNYVFNKGIKRDGHWGSGRSVIRVHDPREFEFEISVDNLIGLLMHSDVSKRDIVEECVFAWLGSELILLPVNSEEYQKSLVYTEKQSQAVSTKSLVPGHVYSQKKQDGNLIYLGFYQWYEMGYDRGDYNTKRQFNKGKRHIFVDENNHFVIPSVSTLAAEVLAEPVSNYADLVDKFYASNFSSKMVKLTKGKGNVKVDVNNNYSSANGFLWLSDDSYAHLNIRGFNNITSDNIQLIYYKIIPEAGDKKEFAIIQTGRSYGYGNSYGRVPSTITQQHRELLSYFTDVEPSNNNYHTYGRKAISPQRLVEALNTLGYTRDLTIVKADGKETSYTNY